MMYKEIRVSKTKMNQFLYIPIKSKNIMPGDIVVVEIYSKDKLIRRSMYTVLEKQVCRKSRNGEKCYSYKYIYIQLPWFNIIRSRGGDPRDLRIVVKSADSIIN